VIVRILGEGQLELDDSQMASLDELDQQLVAALEADDEAKFHDVLNRALAKVRSEGAPVPADRFVPSDLTLPDKNASLADLREFLASEDVGES
jgi:hypothetical protein